MNILLAQVAETAVAADLNSGGKAVMAVSIGGVLCLLSFCLFRVLTLPPVENDDDAYDPPRPLSM